MHISDVESNHGQGRSETAAAAAAAATTNSINDAEAGGAAASDEGTGEQQQMPGEEKANDSIEAGAETARDKQQEQQKGEALEQGLDLEQAGVPKTLKNLNSTMADIINMPDTTTATRTTAEGEGEGKGRGQTNGAESGKYLGQLLPLGRQLANNLPAQSMQEQETDWEQEQTPLAGAKLSGSVQAQSGLPTDQQQGNQATTATSTPGVEATTSKAAASAWTSKQFSTDAGKAGSGLPETLPGSGGGDIAGAGAGAAASNAGTMMDGRQTVDFIEGDSFTSTANYDAVDAVANRKAAKQLQKVEQQEMEQKEHGQQLMKTPPHTSNRVTTAAEAATANN